MGLACGVIDLIGIGHCSFKDGARETTLSMLDFRLFQVLAKGVPKA
jgi:hypothetical protein